MWRNKRLDISLHPGPDGRDGPNGAAADEDGKVVLVRHGVFGDVAGDFGDFGVMVCNKGTHHLILPIKTIVDK
jgi:hypothetical protein